MHLHICSFFFLKYNNIAPDNGQDLGKYFRKKFSFYMFILFYFLVNLLFFLSM